MRLRAGVLGLGSWGRRLAEKVESLPEFELRGVYDPDATKVLPWQERASHCVFSSEESLLASDVEVVFVAVDPERQCALGHRVLAARKALFIEKPCALRPEEAASLAQSARERGLVVGVGHLVRYGEGFSLVERWLRDLEEAGSLLRASFRRNGARARRVHPLWVLGPHEASRLLAWFPSARPVSVERCEDRISARLEDERRVAIELSVASSGPTERTVRIEGTQGFVEFDEGSGLAVRELRKGGEVLREERRIAEDRLREELCALARSVRTGASLPTDAEEGLRVTELLYGIETLGKRTSATAPSRTPTRSTPSTANAIEYSRS